MGKSPLSKIKVGLKNLADFQKMGVFCLFLALFGVFLMIFERCKDEKPTCPLLFLINCDKKINNIKEFWPSKVGKWAEAYFGCFERRIHMTTSFVLPSGSYNIILTKDEIKQIKKTGCLTMNSKRVEGAFLNAYGNSSDVHGHYLTYSDIYGMHSVQFINIVTNRPKTYKLKKRIKEFFVKFGKKFSREQCYNRMEELGIASMGCCSGLSGGDSSTEYLQSECIGCNHLVVLKCSTK